MDNSPLMTLFIHTKVRQHPALAPFFAEHDALVNEWSSFQQMAHHLSQTSEFKHIRAADLNAISLIFEFWQEVLVWYDEQMQSSIITEAVNFTAHQVGDAALDATLESMVRTYFMPKVYGDHIAQYVEEHRVELIKNMLVLHLANENPAFVPFKEWFDDTDLRNTTAYSQVFETLTQFFNEQAPLVRGEGKNLSLSMTRVFGENLIELLRQSFKEYPDSLSEQLAYWRNHWGTKLSHFIPHLLRGIDFIQEANRMPFVSSFDAPAPPPVPVFRRFQQGTFDAFGNSMNGHDNHRNHDRQVNALDAWLEEPEQFSEDLDWMPRVVMMAKSTLVWLDQLSKQYQRPIKQLDQIPDEELDVLAKRGFTALWFIGIWERSHASRKFKQQMGNPEAAASAYSLYDYEIAHELGGYEAFSRLRDRAWQRGIRIACDMVPNHTGIDGKWVIENPDRFVQVSEPPYPSYVFTHENLSDHPDIGIFMEDHYYNHSDAAVVYKRVDFRTGDVRYLYHGNDGTGLPWNDTAQINFLNPEAKEAVIQIILDVARMFPIIRLDAAMVLAKQHIHRLWFPEPGKGGDVASRSNFGMTKAEFDLEMPEEFWREVVDRVAQEVPDTLLLAEAFWMLEGYFVRSLGMHRVYNSAFMHMFRDERNDEFRQLIKNTLDFDPEILKRYVNFLNNPDEKTAVEQFGKGDKYFGATVMLLTLPGLPMFGHGQIEGFSEKYGMEYTKAYYNETPDPWLVDRHEREIVPLIHKRYLFAEVEYFNLYDVANEHGKVNENVFAFSNRVKNEQAVVVYNNSYLAAKGYAKRAVPVKDKTKDRLVNSTFIENLGLKQRKNWFSIFRNLATSDEYIFSNKRLADYGFPINLNGYQYQIYIFVREVEDSMGFYDSLCKDLNGRSVPNVEEAIRERQLFPLHTPFSALLRHLLSPLPEDEILETDQEEVEVEVSGEIEAQEQVDALEKLEAQEEAEVGEMEVQVQEEVEAAVENIPQDSAFIAQFKEGYSAFLHEAADRTGNGVDYVALTNEAANMAKYIISNVWTEHTAPETLETPEILETPNEKPNTENLKPEILNAKPQTRNQKPETENQKPETENQKLETLNKPLWFGWLTVYNLGKLTSQNGKNIGPKSRGFIEAWMLDRALIKNYRGIGLSEEKAQKNAVLIELLTSLQDWFTAEDLESVLEALFHDPAAAHFLHVHVHEGMHYFNKERFEELLALLPILAHLKADDRAPEVLIEASKLVQSWLDRATEVGYKRDAMMLDTL
jgi:glycosidase